MKVSDFINALKSQINKNGRKTSELKITHIEWNDEGEFCEVHTIDKHEMQECYYIE